MVSRLLLRRVVLDTRTKWIHYNATKFYSSHNTAKVYIALGSNVGNPIRNIEKACQELDRSGLRVLRTSQLYETKPMYVEDQANFINGACEVEIKDEDTISPLDLLTRLKTIENDMGRSKTIDKGPRNIDLDILLYGNKTWNDKQLSIPHKAMLEREFVLRPLCDLIPNGRHPGQSGQIFSDQLDALHKDPAMSTVTPFGKSLLKAMDLARETQVMAILNLTPDSFSDGGRHSIATAEILATIRRQINEGAKVIDVGGQSTRPRAPLVSVEEELKRVIPMIKTIRGQFPEITISIDTFRHQVAEEAVKNGADVVNDVSAGTMDPEMLPTIARLGCTYIAMHMRGDPDTMVHLTNYPEGVISGIATELIERVKAAEAAGIRKWRIVLDPGIGFAKNQLQNLEILRKLDQLRHWPGLTGYPWLVGASRKGFIGNITGVKQAHERTWGTAAAVTTSIQGGADIVRVHDVKEMVEVTKMADAIWRLPS